MSPMRSMSVRSCFKPCFCLPGSKTSLRTATLHTFGSQNTGFISILRTMKTKALSLGGDPSGRAAMQQAMLPEDQEEKQEGGAMAARTLTDLKELGLTAELERLTKVFRSCTIVAGRWSFCD